MILQLFCGPCLRTHISIVTPFETAKHNAHIAFGWCLHTRIQHARQTSLFRVPLKTLEVRISSSIDYQLSTVSVFAINENAPPLATAEPLSHLPAVERREEGSAAPASSMAGHPVHAWLACRHAIPGNPVRLLPPCQYQHVRHIHDQRGGRPVYGEIVKCCVRKTQRVSLRSLWGLSICAISL